MGSHEALVGAPEVQKPEAGGSVGNTPCVGHSSGFWRWMRVGLKLPTKDATEFLLGVVWPLPLEQFPTLGPQEGNFAHKKEEQGSQ